MRLVIFLFSLLFLFSGFNHNHDETSELELTNPKWSPNGEFILASSEKYTGLYILDGKTGKLKKSYLKNLTIGYGACWSKSGKYIYYRKKNKDYTFSMKRINIATGAVEKVSKNPQLLTNKSYTDNVATNVFLNNEQALVRKVKENKQQVILSPATNNYYHLISTKNNNYGVVHSGPNMIWVNFKTSKQTVLGKGLANSISPDGKTVYFHRDYSNNGHHINGAEIFSIDVDTKTITQLTNTKDKFEMWPDISPDGKKIAYSDTKSGKIFISPINNLK